MVASVHFPYEAGHSTPSAYRELSFLISQFLCTRKLGSWTGLATLMLSSLHLPIVSEVLLPILNLSSHGIFLPFPLDGRPSEFAGSAVIRKDCWGIPVVTPTCFEIYSLPPFQFFCVMFFLFLFHSNVSTSDPFLGPPTHTLVHQGHLQTATSHQVNI